MKNGSDSNQSFFDKVYDVVRRIPKGRVSTYGHIAEHLGSRGASRMVGWAMNASHSSEIPVPAHRVVNRKGVLTGKHHFHSPDLMQKLLESEGVKVIDDQVQNFHKVVWVPIKELGISGK